MLTTPQAALDAWRQLLGPERVFVGPALPARYRQDTSNCRQEPSSVLRIADAKQLPEVMRIATRHRAPVHPISTGHNWGYGSALPSTEGVTLIDLGELQAILDFDACTFRPSTRAIKPSVRRSD